MNSFYRILTIGILLCACCLVGSAAVPARQISYEVTPQLGSEVPTIKIVLTFKGDASGTTKIKLPLEFAGQEKLYEGIKNLSVMTPGAKLVETDKPEIKIINHSPNQEIKLSYELMQDWAGAPQAGGGSRNSGGGYRPIIQKDYFHFLGSGSWVLPDLADDAKLEVSINWKEIPANFALANSFGARTAKQKFATSIGAFQSSVFVGGDYQINQRMIKGKLVFIATRGQWKFTDQEFADLVEKIVGVEREFWSDYRHPYFLVTLLPLAGDARSKSIGGTGLTNSFATFVTTNVEIKELAFLIAHEYFHNWNTISFGGMKQPEQLIYWFSEGFTDYYTYRLLMRAGLLDLEKYAAQYNEFLSNYYLSPVRNENNQRVSQDFFKDDAVSKLPYRRGFLLATKWNNIIRQQSNNKLSLNDVMHNIFDDAKKKKFKEISKDYVIAALLKYAKYDFAGDVEKYAENGETIGDFDGVLGKCVETTSVSKSVFELGFDYDAARKNKLITGIIPGSAAFDAGLRDNQKVRSLSVYFGAADKPVDITIDENGQPKKISYLPERKEKITVPQFKLKDNLSEDEKRNCLNEPGLFQ